MKNATLSLIILLGILLTIVHGEGVPTSLDSNAKGAYCVPGVGVVLTRISDGSTGSFISLVRSALERIASVGVGILTLRAVIYVIVVCLAYVASRLFVGCQLLFISFKYKEFPIITSILIFVFSALYVRCAFLVYEINTGNPRSYVHFGDFLKFYLDNFPILIIGAVAFGMYVSVILFIGAFICHGWAPSTLILDDDHTGHGVGESFRSLYNDAFVVRMPKYCTIAVWGLFSLVHLKDEFSRIFSHPSASDTSERLD